MLTCPTHLPIYFCAQPVDFRKSFDGLTGVIASVFEISVLDGHLFLFINKRRDRIKAKRRHETRSDRRPDDRGLMGRIQRRHNGHPRAIREPRR